MNEVIAWTIRAFVVSVFSTGYIRLHQRVWDGAFDQGSSASSRNMNRVLLTVLCIGLGFGLAVGSNYVEGMGTMTYQNVGLYIMTIGLFDQHISLPEYWARAAVVLLVWYKTQTVLISANIVVELCILLMTLYLVRRFHSFMRVSWQMTATGMVLAMLYWFDWGGESGMLVLSPTMQVQAFSLFVSMMVFANISWTVSYRTSLRNQDMERLATYDTLTNAKNFTLYQTEVTELFANAKKESKPLTIVALDIDHFKQVNDTYGHLAGNAILIGVATLMEDIASGETGTQHVYRTGGEEFTLAFSDLTPEQVLPVVNKVCLAVRNRQFKYGENNIAVTLSVGITAVRSIDRTIDDVFKRADDSLYASKHRGRDAITVEGVPIQADKDGVRQTRYAYFAQSIVDTSTAGNTRWGGELLLRMYDEQKARWVLPESFDISVRRQLHLLQDALSNSGCRRLTLNLTTEQFADTDVAQAIADYRRATPELEALIVEITQVPHLQSVRRVASIYHAADVLVFIDDVGSDNRYSEVLNVLPFADGVKFAMQNLRGQDTREKMFERLGFWKQVASDNDLHFVLEGVETRDDMEITRDRFGIRYMQGYYFDKPSLPDAT
jgi:diguanylate cyclase (GGDEF)-like protein